MIEEIRGRFKMEIRPNSQGYEYLEAVIGRDELELLKSVLTKHLGCSAKEPEREANLPIEIQRLVDSMGGLRVDQSFYYSQGDNGEIAFAFLWPWASNSKKVTLKAGRRSIA